jgi:hypothetical protein
MSSSGRIESSPALRVLKKLDFGWRSASSAAIKPFFNLYIFISAGSSPGTCAASFSAER